MAHGVHAIVRIDRLLLTRAETTACAGGGARRAGVVFEECLRGEALFKFVRSVTDRRHGPRRGVSAVCPGAGNPTAAGFQHRSMDSRHPRADVPHPPGACTSATVMLWRWSRAHRHWTRICFAKSTVLRTPDLRYDRLGPHWDFDLFLHHVLPEDREHAAHAFREGVDAKAEWSLECRITRLDGALRRIWIHGDILTDGSGSAVRTVGIILDITDRNGPEAQTLLLADQLTTSLDSMSDAFYTLDRDWRFTFLNHHAEKLLARSGDELLGRNVWDEFPGTLGSPIEHEYRRAMSDKVTVAFEHFFAPLDICFSIRAYPSPQGLAVYSATSRERRAADACTRGAAHQRLNRGSRCDAAIQPHDRAHSVVGAVSRYCASQSNSVSSTCMVGRAAPEGGDLSRCASAGEVGDFSNARLPGIDCRRAHGSAGVLRERTPQGQRPRRRHGGRWRTHGAPARLLRVITRESTRRAPVLAL